MIKNRISNRVIIVSFIILLIIIASFSLIMSSEVAHASTDIFSDEFDNTFYQTVNTLVGKSNKSVESEIDKEMIYDVYKNPLGYIYVFKIQDSFGYAILIDLYGEIRVTELVIDSNSPYANYVGHKIYIREFTYANCDDEMFNILGTNMRLTLDEVVKLFPTFYCGATNLQNMNYSINYISKSENQHSLAQTIPAYYRTNLLNSCMPLAGTNIVVYFDRFKTDLIPNYTPGNSLGSKYKYKQHNTKIDEVISQLYIDMETNTTGVGTSIAQFKQGLTKYCERSGNKIEFEECMLNSQLDLQKVQKGLLNNCPIVLFVDKLEIADIVETEMKDSYATIFGYANHAMVGFGYRQITYKLADNTTSSSNFILVASGLESMPKAYLNTNNNLIVDMAYIISIY